MRTFEDGPGYVVLKKSTGSCQIRNSFDGIFYGNASKSCAQICQKSCEVLATLRTVLVMTVLRLSFVLSRVVFSKGTKVLRYIPMYLYFQLYYNANVLYCTNKFMKHKLTVYFTSIKGAPANCSLTNFLLQYNVNKSGYYGVGGEYAVQNGYASTNGAVLRLLELFPTELSDNGNNEIFDREETVNGVHKEISKERDNLKDSDVFQFDAQLSSAMADTNKKSESASHKREEPSSATGINAEHSPQKLSRLNSGTKYCQSSVQLSVSILLILVINIHI